MALSICLGLAYVGEAEATVWCYADYEENSECNALAREKMMEIRGIKKNGRMCNGSAPKRSSRIMGEGLCSMPLNQGCSHFAKTCNDAQSSYKKKIKFCRQEVRRFQECKKSAKKDEEIFIKEREVKSRRDKPNNYTSRDNQRSQMEAAFQDKQRREMEEAFQDKQRGDMEAAFQDKQRREQEEAERQAELARQRERDRLAELNRQREKLTKLKREKQRERERRRERQRERRREAALEREMEEERDWQRNSQSGSGFGGFLEGFTRQLNESIRRNRGSGSGSGSGSGYGGGSSGDCGGGTCKTQ